MLPSFFGLDSIVPTAGVRFLLCHAICLFYMNVRHNAFAMFHATPVGQASNPGPESQGIRLAICNPTAVHKKVGLLRKFDAQIIAASETSATNVIQKQVSTEFSKIGFRSFWSLPVAPKKVTHDNRPSFRGEAVGSAIFSSLPARQVRCEIPTALKESQRFSACIVRLATSEILFICLYGFANRYREGKRPNDLLLASIIPIISVVGLPFVICGDFNEPVCKLPAFKYFKDLGAVEAFSWFFAKTGTMLPPTCSGSTRNDSAILHPHVAAWISDMHVISEHQMDIHTPLFIDFNCQQIKVPQNIWKLPKTWAHFAPKCETIQRMYQTIDFQTFFGKDSDFDCNDMEDAFLLWSRNVEKAIDKAIAEDHKNDPISQPRNSLPSSYKGRCNFKQIFHTVHKPRVKSDRHGGYCPPAEVLSLRSRLKIRQVRRLHSLCRRYKSLPLDESGFPGDSPTLSDAYKERKCILYAKGYGNSWMNWALSFEIIPALSLWLPSFQLLETLTQITQHDCDHTCRDEATKRANDFKLRIHIDVHDDYSRMSYKLIRAKDTQPLNEVPVLWKTGFQLLRSVHGNTALRIDEDIQIPPFAKLTVNDACLRFVRQDGKKVIFTLVSGSLPPSGELAISFVATTPHEIGQEFSSFWRKMWMRDLRQEQFSDDNWKTLDDLICDTPLPLVPQITYSFSCVRTWMNLIRKLPSGKAIGACGWSFDELKALPEVCIRDLCWIFQKVSATGFSKKFMTAKTILLSKVPTPQSMNHARPITILSCLYRLFGKFIFSHTAQVWRQYFPFPISGGLPGRGVKELAYSQKRIIEDAVSDNKAIGGFSLDLIKAYNTFGRRAVHKIMCRLGMPECVLDAWISSLDVMTRYPYIQGIFTDGITSTTGVPEGCSVSVLSMLATSTLYFYRLTNQQVHPFAYADNWSWMSMQQRSHAIAYQRMLHLVQVLRLQVDFAKSWHWGTTKQFRDFCKTLMTDDDGRIQCAEIKSCVKDLGELVHYNRSASIGFIREKIEEGVNRIQRIEWLPCDLQKKSLFIQTSVWPLALYSCDTIYIGQKHFEKLRRATVNTLVGHWHNASPMLACSFLSKFLKDPFLYTLCQCARIIRRLSTVQHCVAKETIAFACSFEGSRPFGPASTLKHYIKQIGWALDTQGNISGPDHWSCNLLHDPERRIINVFHCMWSHYIIQMIDRKGIGEHLPDPRLAVKVFSDFPDEAQQLIKLNIVGGFQTQSMKSKWDHDIDDGCKFCGESDTREHRLLSCPVVGELRTEHTRAIEILTEERNEWIYVPLPRQHEMSILLRAYIKLIKPPIIPSTLHVVDGDLCFFTDGGALHPSCASARLASWSVIQDVAHDDGERKHNAAFLHCSQPKFPSFKVVALGMVYGDQNVSRGELLAILTATKIASQYVPPRRARFVTDAMYVCNVIRLIANGTWKHIAHRLPNCDLIAELALIWDSQRFSICKVKSHRSFESASDFKDLWMIAGNYCADLAATAAFKCVPSDIRKLSDEIAAFTICEKQRLQCVFDYLQAFNKRRCEATNELSVKGIAVTTTFQNPRCPQQPVNGKFPSDLMGLDAVNFLSTFQPTDYMSLHFAEVDESIFYMSLQGANIAHAVVHWLRSLKWPVDMEVHDQTDWGISWFELAISFYLYTGFRFPVRISGAGNKSQYAAYDSNDAILLPGHQRAAVLQGICLRNMIANLSTIMEMKVFPTFNTFKCQILCRIAQRRIVVAGINRRPCLPNPSETMKFVSSYIFNLKGVALNEPIFCKDLVPTIVVPPIFEPETVDRYNRYASFMKVKRKQDASAGMDDN